MKLERFTAADIYAIDLQPAQAASWLAHGSREYAEMLARHLAYTLRDAERVIACAGVVPCDRDVGFTWAFLSVHARPHLARLHKAALRMFEVSGFARLIATSEADFTEGCRWLELLGFTRDEPLPGYGPDGRDHVAYVRSL